MARTGIPALERFIARLLIRRWTNANPPERAATLLREQQRELVSLIQRTGPKATKRVQIKRLRGLEESSTNYSLAMVADHLARVNSDLALALGDLVCGRPSSIEVSIAKYKPDAAAQPDTAMHELDASITALESVLSDPEAIRRSTATHIHPWFGALPATVWASFGPFHQALHLRQARAIVAGL